MSLRRLPEGCSPAASDWPGAGALLSIFLGLVVFYAVSIPANHFDSVDGYSYALGTETLAMTEIVDTRSIAFQLINSILYQTQLQLGFGWRAFDVIVALVVFTAAGGVILMARLLIKELGLPASAGWSGATLLAISYGYWRYAVEAEVYVPSIFLILATLNLLLPFASAKGVRVQSLLSVGALSGFSVLYYQPNIIPLCFASLVLFASRGRFNRYIAYGLVVFFIVLSGFMLAHFAQNQRIATLWDLIAFANSRGDEFPVMAYSLKGAVDTLRYWVELVFSLRWMYGVDTITQFLGQSFGFNPAIEQVFASSHFRPFIYSSLLLAPLTAFGLVMLIFQATRRWASLGAVATNWSAAFPLLWLGLYSAIILLLDPMSYEPWIMLLPPIVALTSYYLFVPSSVGSYRIAIGFLLVTILANNWFGGLGMSRSADGDYFSQRAQWLAEHARTGDVVLFRFGHAKWQELMTFQYHTGIQCAQLMPDTKVAEAHAIRLGTPRRFEEFVTTVSSVRGRLFVYDNFFPPADERLRSRWCREDRVWCQPEGMKERLDFLTALRSKAVRVYTGPLAGIYEIPLGAQLR